MGWLRAYHVAQRDVKFRGVLSKSIDVSQNQPPVRGSFSSTEYAGLSRKATTGNFSKRIYRNTIVVNDAGTQR